MNITPLDLAVFIGFFVIVIGLSVWKSRRRPGHDEDSSDFFLAGRGLSWPLIGISIVAANISTEQMVGMAGQAAGSTGLAVSCWQLLGSVFIVIIAMTLLPKFLRAGIYTMPEYLEYRYNTAARGLMALLTVVIYTVVMLPAVLYSGGVTLRAITGMDLTRAVWLIGLIGAGYSTIGGLKAIAWADLVQGLALLAGGMLIFYLGLDEIGGWKKFSDFNADKLHMILPAENTDLPWTGVAGGMWIVMIYYCGLNQFIVQRNLASECGDFAEMAVTAHSPLSYYRGLSLRELGRDEDAEILFQELSVFAISNIGKPAAIDYFATSLPNLLVFEEDLQARRDAEYQLLAALACHGLGDISGAASHLAEVSTFTNADQRSADLTAELARQA